jgi:hypothetical protein
MSRPRDHSAVGWTALFGRFPLSGQPLFSPVAAAAVAAVAVALSPANG